MRPPRLRESTLVRLLVHLLSLGAYLCHHWYMAYTIANCNDREHVFFADYRKFGGRWKYLTALTESTITIYLVSAVVADVMPFVPLRKFMRSLCDLVFTSVIWPIVMIVVVFFWSLFWYDRELIMPAKDDVCIPQLLNHGWHTLPLIVVAVENVFIRHKYPSNCVASVIMLLTSSSYTVWLLIIYYVTNEWVYPFMNVFTPLTFVVFTGLCTLVEVGLYFVGKTIAAYFFK